MTLQTGYVPGLAAFDGSNPATAVWRFALEDHLGSPRAYLGQSKAAMARYDFSPYGELMRSAGLPLTVGFTGHLWDPALRQYFAPFCHFNPKTARWNMPDPLGMVDGPNVYAYVAGNPVINNDKLGLSARIPGCRRPNKPNAGDWNRRNQNQEPEWEYPYVPKDSYDDAMRLLRGEKPIKHKPAEPGNGRKNKNPNRYQRGNGKVTEYLQLDDVHPNRPEIHVDYIRHERGVGGEKWIIYPDGSCEKVISHGNS